MEASPFEQFHCATLLTNRASEQNVRQMLQYRIDLISFKLPFKVVHRNTVMFALTQTGPVTFFLVFMNGHCTRRTEELDSNEGRKELVLNGDVFKLRLMTFALKSLIHKGDLKD